MKIFMFRKALLWLFLLLCSYWAQAQNTIYQHNFNQAGPGPYSNPYAYAPVTLDGHLSNSKWTLNTGSWTSYNGVGGNYALATNNAAPGSKTLDLSFDVAAQYALSITGVSFYHRSSSTGYNHWDLLINNVNVASGNIFVDVLGGSAPVQGTGAITFNAPAGNLSGTVHAALVLSGGAHGSNATFRFDEFKLTGSVFYNPGGGTNPPAMLSGSGLDGSFNVSDLGAANYSIPIQAPAGINGMSPSLAFSYSSQGGNGILGSGWTISGMSSITRVPNSIYHDKNVSGVSLTANDKFALDGNRLIATSGTYGTAGSQYHTEIESFRTITASGTLGNGPASFTVTDERGWTFHYGSTANAQVQAPGIATPYMWLLDKVIDLNGNYMTYSYMRNNTTGEVVLQDIVYTGNANAGLSPLSNVHFEYGPRSDVQSIYVGGGKIVNALKLNSITCTENVNNVAHYYRTYTFEYSEPLQTHLDKIKVRGQDNTETLAPAQFVYGEPSAPATMLIANNQPASGDYAYVSGDFNGDGLSDYVRFQGTQQGQLYTNTGTGIRMSPIQSWSLPSILAGSKIDGINFNPQTSNAPLSFFDYDGDGKDDLCYLATKPRVTVTDELRIKYCLMISNGYQLLPAPPLVHPTTYNELLSNTTPLVGDFDGDGKSEIFLLNNQNYVYNNNFMIGSSYCTTQTVGGNTVLLPRQVTDAELPFDPTAAQWMSVIDYDGDGKSDLAIKINNTLTVYKFNITFDANNNPVLGSTLLTLMGTTNLDIYNNYAYRIYPRDFNGDKITDILVGGYYTADWACSWKIYYGKGDGMFDTPVPVPYLGGNFDPTWNTPGQAPLYQEDPKVNLEEKVFDFNGDGKCDIYIKSTVTPYTVALDYCPYKIYYGQGNNTFSPTMEMTDSSLTKTFSDAGSGDYDGDGLVDFLHWPDNSVPQQSMISFNPKEKRNQIATIHDGLGITTKIAYDYLTNPSVYEPGGASYSFPFVKKALPLTVVSVVNRDNGINTTGNNMIYTYTGYKYHALGKGIMGFDNVNQYDVAANLDRTQSYSLNATYAVANPETMVTRQHTTSASVNQSVSSFSFYHYGNNRIFVYPTQINSSDYLTNTTTATTYNFTTTLGLPGGPPSSVDIGKPMSIMTNKGSGLEISTQAFVFPNKGSNPLYRYVNPSRITTTNTRQGQAAYTRITDYTYNPANGLPATVTTDPGAGDAVTTTFSYNALGNAAQKVTSASGLPSVTSITTYDPTNRFVEKSYNNAYPDVAAQSTFDPVSGNVLSTLSADGLVNNMTYDGFGRTKTVVLNSGASSQVVYGPASGFSGLAPTNAVYGIQTSPNTAQPSYKFYDRLNRLVRTAYPGFDGTMIFEDITYNSTLGQIASKTKPYFSNGVAQNISFTYDDYGRQIQITAPEGNTTASYQVSSGLYKVATTNMAGQQKTTAADASGRTKTDNDDAGTLEYIYHSNGQVKQVNLNGSMVSQMSFDNFGRRTEEYDPNLGGTGKYLYAYNTYGQLLSQEDPQNQTTTFTAYDGLGNLLSKTAPEGNYTYSYAYSTGSDCGKLVQSTGPDNVTHDYENHMGGGLLSEIFTNNEQTLETRFTYDNTGRLASRTYPDSTRVIYTYSLNDGSMAGIGRAGDSVSVFTPGGAQIEPAQLYGIINKEASGHTTLAGYRSVDVPGSVSVGNPFYRFAIGNTNNYDAASGLLQEQLAATLSTPGIPAVTYRDYQYNFDPASRNLLGRKDAKYNLMDSFAYDNLNRLIRLKGPVGNAADMSYANNGNINSKSDAGIFSYDQANRLHRIDSYVNIPEEEQDVTYTAFNKVSEITEGDDKVTFSYWDNGNRSAMKYYHTGILQKAKYYAPLFEREIDSITGQVRNLCYVVGPEGNVVAILEKKNGMSKKYSVLTDHQGSITQIIDEAGTLTQEKSYDAWGRRRNPLTWAYLPATGQSNGWDRGYTGHEYITQFGIINMNGRLYDPLLGRMFSPDPNIMGNDNTQGYNRYSYALNNPLKYVDPTGYIVEYSETITRQRNPFILNEADQWGYLGYYRGTQLLKNFNNWVDEVDKLAKKIASDYFERSSEPDYLSQYGGTLLPEVAVRGTINNHLYGWTEWGEKMQERFGAANPLDVPAFDQFSYDQGWSDPFVRAARLGYSPWNPDAVVLTIPVSVIGISGFSGSLNIGFVGNEFGIYVNGGYNVGLPDVGIGIGLTLSEHNGPGKPTFDSYMGYGQSWNAGFGLFGSYSEGYEYYDAPNPIWRSYTGGVGAVSPSANWSPMNYSKKIFSFKMR